MSDNRLPTRVKPEVESRESHKVLQGSMNKGPQVMFNDQGSGQCDRKMLTNAACHVVMLLQVAFEHVKSKQSWCQPEQQNDQQPHICHVLSTQGQRVHHAKLS